MMTVTTSENTQITDYDIQALVDGEVDSLKAAVLLDAVRQNPTLYSRYMQYKKQKALLKLWWKDN